MSERPIPILDLLPEIDELWDELENAFRRVMRSGRFILGPEVAAFEGEAAEYLGVQHAVGVNSGTDALVIGLRALGIGPGDEVITTSFSFFATAESISQIGATPVFVDVDESTFNLDPSLVEAAITPRTKAIMPVHLYGRPCAMDELMAIAGGYGLHVVEDCAQSFGARYVGRMTGTIGAVGAYSFFPSKNLGGFGDGGLIVTNDDGVADRARTLRAHGSKRKYQNEVLGYNSRLDEVQAALLRVKLPHVDRWNGGRRERARAYGTALAGLQGIQTPDIVDGHVFHQYTIKCEASRRDAFVETLATAGIGTMVYYPVPQHRLPVYDQLEGSLPVTEALAKQVVSLPIGPNLSSEALDRVTEAVRTAS